MINQDIAKIAVNKAGMGALGLASGMLAIRWTEIIPNYDSASMTLSSTSPWKAMTGGLFSWHTDGDVHLSDSDGLSLTGQIGILEFHPQAALRIRRLIGSRYDGRTDGLANRPTPFYAALQNSPPIADILTAPIQANVSEDLFAGNLSFHDERGMIIDPIAVASFFLDLTNIFNALSSGSGGSGVTVPGSVNSITNLSAKVRRVHFVNLFGGPWVDRPDQTGLRFGSDARLNGSIHSWPSGKTINPTDTPPDNLRWGLSPEGTLDVNPLSPPALSSTIIPVPAAAPNLKVQFLRVVIVDLSLHLLGNRSPAAIDSVPAPDNKTLLEPGPEVVDGEIVSFLQDGQVMSGGIAEIASLSGFRLAVSPSIQTNQSLPPDRSQQWPTFPATTETPQSLTGEISKLSRSEMTASYVGSGPDVLVTWPAGSLPSEAHIRIFPRVDPGPAIVPLAELDFARRGEGGSGIAKAAGITISLKDPFRVGTDTPVADPRLRFDLLIVTRDGTVQGRLLGGLDVQVATGATAPVLPAVSNPLGGVPLNQRGISPSPLIGIAPTSPSPGTNPILNALGEAAPRESPRFRTMGRLSSLVAGHDAGLQGTWTAVNTSGILDGRSVRGDADLGNPGNPAGPEDHAPGVFLTGTLAMAHARAALRRTHHIVRRMPELNDDRWNDLPAGTGNFAGAVLQNIAATVESPELDLVPEDTAESLPSDWAGVVSALQSFLPASLVGAIPTPGAGDRWVEEVKRDTMAAKNGRRDSQWSWRWAISHARQLIYLETPLFSSTASGSAEHEVNLLQVLLDRLAEAPGLHVILALPKRIPFGPGYESFAQYFYQERNKAIEALQTEAPDRVVAFHPIGFPGRPEVIRGTVGVIDDIWALLGSSTFSRRGLTFDGSIDTVFLDKNISGGVSTAIKNLRKNSIARTLALLPSASGETPNANFVRLNQPLSTFKLIKEIVERGGDGLVEPLWDGLPLSELSAQDKAIADPDGRGFSAVAGTFTALLADLGADKS